MEGDMHHLKPHHLSAAKLAAMSCLGALIAATSVAQANPAPPDGRGEPTIILNGEPVYFDDDDADLLDNAPPHDTDADTPPPSVDDTAYAPGPEPSLRPADARSPQALDQQPLSTLDLHLEAVVALIEEDRVTDAEHLEELINSAKTGINNVDLDDDGFVDFVAVREVREHDTILFELIAMPSSDPDAEGLTIASISFRELNGGGGDVEIVAAYSDYVEGHEETAFASIVQHPIYTDSYQPRGFIDWVYIDYRPIYLFSPIYAFTPVWYTCAGTTLAQRRATFRRRCGLSRVPTCSRRTQWHATGTRTPPRRVHRVPPKFAAPKVRRAPRSYPVKPPSPRLQADDTLSFIPAQQLSTPSGTPLTPHAAPFNRSAASGQTFGASATVNTSAARRRVTSRAPRPGQDTFNRPPARPFNRRSAAPSSTFRRPRITRPGINPGAIQRARRANAASRRRVMGRTTARAPRTPIRATARTRTTIPTARRPVTLTRRPGTLARPSTPRAAVKARSPQSLRRPSTRLSRPSTRTATPRRPTARTSPRPKARPRAAERRPRTTTSGRRTSTSRSSSAARPSPRRASSGSAQARRPKARTRRGAQRAPAAIKKKATPRRAPVKGFSPRTKR